MENKEVTIDLICFHYGQKWKERDNRFTRIVEICGMDTEKKKVKIRTVGLSGPSKIERWVKVEAFTTVKGKRRRFDLYSAPPAPKIDDKIGGEVPPNVWEKDGKWYHRDEAEQAHGPFDSKEQAEAALKEYCEKELGVEPKDLEPVVQESPTDTH